MESKFYTYVYLDMRKSRKYKYGQIANRSGENNSNFGNNWSEKQKEKASKLHKGKWIGDKNPSKINPKCGMINGISQYKYYLYDNDVLIDEGYSLTLMSRENNLNYNMLRKISKNGNKYLKRYIIKREKWR